MSAGIIVHDFRYKPGENDAAYIALLEDALERQKQLTWKAIVKVRQLSQRVRELEQAGTSSKNGGGYDG